MELYTFHKQLGAGMSFFSYETNDVPQEVFDDIKLKAFSEWPEDYEMRLHVLEKQLAACRELQNF